MKEVRRPLCQHAGEAHFRNGNSRTEAAQIAHWARLRKSRVISVARVSSVRVRLVNEGDISLCLFAIKTALTCSQNRSFQTVLNKRNDLGEEEVRPVRIRKRSWD